MAAEIQPVPANVNWPEFAWESYMSTSCPFCKTVKRKLDIFCWRCWNQIPRTLMALLRLRFHDERRITAFRDAMAHLKKLEEQNLTADQH